MDTLKTIQTLVDDLQSTTSSNKKIEILETYSEIEDVRKMLVQIYSPYILFSVSSKNCKKNSSLVQYGYTNLFDLLRDLSNRLITGHEAISYVNGFVNANNKYEEIIWNILDKDLKTRTGASLINKAIPNLIPQFKVALAQAFEKAPDFESEDWYASRKLDGVRCLAVVDVEGKCKLYSRQGKEFTTLDKVKHAIEATGIINTVFDGEICMMDKDGNEDFQSVMKEIRRKDHQIANPTFMLFDMIHKTDFDNNESTEVLSDRLHTLRSWLGPRYDTKDTLRYLEQEVVTDDSHFDVWTQMATDNDWEGFMLRKDVGYEGKRSKNLLKVKKFHDAEYIVESCDFETHRIIKDGKEVSMPMLAQVYITHKGNQVAVGSGFNQAQRIKYQLNPEGIIGKTITVQYFEESQNKEGDYSLRFPVIKHIYEGERDC